MRKENRIFPVTALLSFASAFLFCQDAAYKVSLSGALVFAAFFALLVLAAKGMRVRPETGKLIFDGGLLCLLTGAAIQAVCMFRETKDVWSDKGAAVAPTCAAAALVLLTVLYVFARHRGDWETVIFLLILCSFLLRLFYVVLTQAHIYQNDAGVLAEGTGGHLGYIYYLYGNGRLPDFDPRQFDQYYHPPLHHAVCALLVRAGVAFGVPVAGMDEILQLLPLFYTAAALGFLNKIGIRMRLPARARFVCVGLSGFLPYGVMMSGALNNDAPTALFLLMFVYFTMKWYEEPRMSSVLAMAAAIGCAMTTKLSGVLLAPAGALVMLAGFWRGRAQWRRLAGQFAAFGALAFPIGLWHPVRNLIRYGIPLGYVPELSPELDQYIGAFSMKDRFLDFAGQLGQLDIQWSRFEPGVDHNILLSLVKFSVFGEANYYKSNGTVQFFGTAMFWLTAFVLLASVCFFVRWCFRKNGQGMWKLFFGAGLGTVLFSYVKFCLDYPHICTMNVRYVMIALFLGFLGMCAGLPGPSGTGAAGRAASLWRYVPAVFTCVYMSAGVLLICNLEMLLF